MPLNKKIAKRHATRRAANTTAQAVRQTLVDPDPFCVSSPKVEDSDDTIAQKLLRFLQSLFVLQKKAMEETGETSFHMGNPDIRMTLGSMNLPDNATMADYTHPDNLSVWNKWLFFLKEKLKAREHIIKTYEMGDSELIQNPGHHECYTGWRRAFYTEDANGLRKLATGSEDDQRLQNPLLNMTKMRGGKKMALMVNAVFDLWFGDNHLMLVGPHQVDPIKDIIKAFWQMGFYLPHMKVSILHDLNKEDTFKNHTSDRRQGPLAVRIGSHFGSDLNAKNNITFAAEILKKRHIAEKNQRRDIPGLGLGIDEWHLICCEESRARPPGRLFKKTMKNDRCDWLWENGDPWKLQEVWESTDGLSENERYTTYYEALADAKYDMETSLEKMGDLPSRRSYMTQLIQSCRLVNGYMSSGTGIGGLINTNLIDHDQPALDIASNDMPDLIEVNQLEKLTLSAELKQIPEFADETTYTIELTEGSLNPSMTSPEMTKGIIAAAVDYCLPKHSPGMVAGDGDFVLRNENNVAPLQAPPGQANRLFPMMAIALCNAFLGESDDGMWKWVDMISTGLREVGSHLPDIKPAFIIFSQMDKNEKNKTVGQPYQTLIPHGFGNDEDRKDNFSSLGEAITYLRAKQCNRLFCVGGLRWICQATLAWLNTSTGVLFAPTCGIFNATDKMDLCRLLQKLARICNKDNGARFGPRRVPRLCMPEGSRELANLFAEVNSNLAEALKPPDIRPQWATTEYETMTTDNGATALLDEETNMVPFSCSLQAASNKTAQDIYDRALKEMPALLPATHPNPVEVQANVRERQEITERALAAMDNARVTIANCKVTAAKRTFGEAVPKPVDCMQASVARREARERALRKARLKALLEEREQEERRAKRPKEVGSEQEKLEQELDYWNSLDKNKAPVVEKLNTYLGIGYDWSQSSWAAFCNKYWNATVHAKIEELEDKIRTKDFSASKTSDPKRSSRSLPMLAEAMIAFFKAGNTWTDSPLGHEPDPFNPMQLLQLARLYPKQLQEWMLNSNIELLRARGTQSHIDDIRKVASNYDRYFTGLNA